MKYKCMTRLTISYLPWIIYWTFSACGNKFGSFIMLIISLVYVLIGIKKGNISLMDEVAIGFSVISIIFGYFLNSNLFVIGDGYLGYGTLFIMSILSLFSTPFMLYYLKKDFEKMNVPKKLVLLINNIWSIVFFISTFIFIYIDTPVLAVISSNIIVLVAIISSILITNNSWRKYSE